MKIVLIHLSDVHLKEDAGENPILHRIDAISNAVGGLGEQAAAYIVVASGDIAFSGRSKEYQHAFSLFEHLHRALVRRFSPQPIFCIIVPGNHDCDFSDENQTRAIVLDRIKGIPINDESPMQLGLQVQTAYRDFVTSLPSQSAGVNLKAVIGWCEKASFAINDKTISLRYCQMLWMRDGRG
jgi:hypothetical protein